MSSLHRKLSPRRAFALAAAIALLVGVGVGIADAGDAGRPKAAPSAVRDGASPRERALALRQFALLREGQAPSETPPQVLTTSTILEGRGIAVDRDSVREAKADSKHTVYVFAADGRLCWQTNERSGSGGVNCTSDPGKAARGDLGPSIDYLPSGVRVTALVPDGTSDVRIELSDGTVEEVRVVHNVVSAQVAAPPEAVSWRTPDGEERKFDTGRLLRGPK